MHENLGSPPPARGTAMQTMLQVAVKILPEAGNANPAFQQELTVVAEAALRCRGVCRLYGSCLKNNRPCIIMKQYASSLATRLTSGKHQAYAQASTGLSLCSSQ